MTAFMLIQQFSGFHCSICFMAGADAGGGGGTFAPP